MLFQEFARNNFKHLQEIICSMSAGIHESTHSTSLLLVSDAIE